MIISGTCIFGSFIGFDFGKNHIICTADVELSSQASGRHFNLDFVIIVLTLVPGFDVSMQGMYTATGYTGNQAYPVVGNGRSQTVCSLSIISFSCF